MTLPSRFCNQFPLPLSGKPSSRDPLDNRADNAFLQVFHADSQRSKVLCKFKKGEKVKTKYGKIRTVAFQRDIQVFVEEESNC
jgi:hypothetical protein